MGARGRGNTFGRNHSKNRARGAAKPPAGTESGTGARGRGKTLGRNNSRNGREGARQNLEQGGSREMARGGAANPQSGTEPGTAARGHGNSFSRASA
ncbi:hypothetical protein JTE90_021137 [Oedothorax gibbosus]|uniref:Uncharacterized protein n=1 Tax=Oedothorax gibbosus TaxID=931172 RepID=A0AAV6U2J2_9ARAC|nr:hypothetical protein JTE90_021137 [Oedothorax gibbosus]